MKNTKLWQRVKDYIIIASHIDGRVTEINLIKDLVNEIEALEQVNKNDSLPNSDSSLADQAIMEYDLAIKRDLPNTWVHVRDHGRHATFCDALNDIRNKVRANYR
jgi:hypothetical protein